MSELKPYIGPHPTDHTLTEYYLKSEADKLIAEKDKVIAELEKKIKLYEDLGSCKKGCPALRHNQRRVESEIYRVKLKENEITEKDKELRHNKYKRCLAMAGRCRLRGRLFGACGLYEKELWALKWHKRWLELAEKFKEAK